MESQFNSKDLYELIDRIEEMRDVYRISEKQLLHGLPVTTRAVPVLVPQHQQTGNLGNLYDTGKEHLT